MNEDAISLCMAAKISPQTMLARLLLSGASNDAICRALSAHPDRALLLEFFLPRAVELDRMRTMLQCVDHAHECTPEAIAAQFDAALALAPEASVAAYSLNDPALLAAATTEVVQWLQAEALFAPGMDVLDFGCGFGRIAVALAPVAGSVLGLDIAPGMIAEARRRFGHVARLRFQVVPGGCLDALASHRFDLVLAVDSFPYVFQAGTAQRQFAGLNRVLRPGGALVILNLSYNQSEVHRAQAIIWAQALGLTVDRTGDHPFSGWDAEAFVFRAAQDRT